MYVGDIGVVCGRAGTACSEYQSLSTAGDEAPSTVEGVRLRLAAYQFQPRHLGEHARAVAECRYSQALVGRRMDVQESAFIDRRRSFSRSEISREIWEKK